MAESNSLQPLIKVSTEVEESQTKLHLINFCIKAQQDLVSKLRKEAQRRKENCSFVKNNNLQLESEIKHAECEIKSLMKSYETIKSANVELKKELLLSQNFNLELVERMREGEIKYENLWQESKRRYESIPFVQDWLTASKNAETMKSNLSAYENEAKIMHSENKSRKRALDELDRKQIIRLAEFFVHVLPQQQQIIRQKSLEIKALQQETEKLSKQRGKKVMPSAVFVQSQTPKHMINTDKGDDGWPTLNRNNDELPMPKLRLASANIDVLSVKLELNKFVNMETSPIKKTSSITDCTRNAKPQTEEKQNNDYISSYFNKPKTNADIENSKDTGDNFAKRKLINILEDITLDNYEAYEIVSKVNPVQLMEVDTIGDNAAKQMNNEGSKNKVKAPLESEEIEEIDLTAISEFQNLLMPPSQFVDLTQENILRSSQKQVEVIVHMDMDGMQEVPGEQHSQTLKNSQEAKKKVTFDIPTTIQEEDNEIENLDNSLCTVANTTSETVNSQMDGDIPSVTDENYMKIKDMILKKHHLDLSPQFIYAKNSMLQKKNEEGITSKFFDNANQNTENETKSTSKNANTKVVEKIDESKEERQNIESAAEKSIKDVVVIEEAAVNKSIEPVTGMLFTHGPQGIPESLDVSMSTTGFEDGDGDYPHCLDSSLLLSPKADITMSANNENKNEIDSQELPNFLTGFRKTGLSFFGKTSKENVPESSGSLQENNFNFNFGSQEKKRGGLFSFFN